ncbi:MAG: hypothetical protein C0614_07785 [Desulfuromonas sp.]|nr:MAG: hypothetical protein C0614_07785 [Desulfuromonas sp.]
MKRLLLLITLVCLTSVSAHAELAYSELVHSYQKSAEQKSQPLDSYLMGLYEGIKAANLAYYMQTRQRLFCKPDNLEMNARDLFKLIKDSHDSFDKANEIPVSYLLFIGLRQTFPCL